MELKAGDTVILKSGEGPKMEVIKVTKAALVRWKDAYGKKCFKEIDLASLTTTTEGI